MMSGENLALFRAEVFRGIRSPRFLLLGLGLPLGVFVGYTATGIGGPINRLAGGIGGPSHLMVSMAAFGAMNAAVAVAAGRLGTTSDGSLTGRSLLVRAGSAMILAASPLILLTIAGVLEGIRLPGAEWFALVVSLWLGALPFIALGLLLGPILDADTGEVVLLSILIVLGILGGLFQPIETLPSNLAWVTHVLPSFHLADLGWTALAARASDPTDVLVLAGYTIGIGAGAIAVRRNWSEVPQVGD